MRFVAGVALGLVLGLVGARELFPGPQGPARTGPAGAAPSPAPALPEPKAPVSAEPSAGGPRGPLVIRRSGPYTTTDDLIIIPDGEVLGGATRTLTDIRRALVDARAAADWSAFFRALNEAGAMNTPESQALLVEVMGDESLRFEGPWTGQSFLRWLSACDAPGLLEAARRRAEIDIADNPESRWRGVGWLSLVAMHGGAAEIAWIESLGRGEQNAEMEVDRALAEAAANPLAAARLAARVKEAGHHLNSPYLEAFARANPQAALDAAIEALPAKPDRRTSDLLRLIGEATTPETVERARTALLRIEDPAVRFETLRAVERMRRRGLDVSGFARLADEPRLLLERSASRPLADAERALVQRALQSISFSRVTWNDATIAAVRPFLSHPDATIAAAAKEAMADIAEGASGDGWHPERSAK